MPAGAGLVVEHAEQQHAGGDVVAGVAQLQRPTGVQRHPARRWRAAPAWRRSRRRWRSRCICQPDSCQDTASASCGSTPCRRAVSTITRRTWARPGWAVRRGGGRRRGAGASSGASRLCRVVGRRWVRGCGRFGPCGPPRGPPGSRSAGRRAALAELPRWLWEISSAVQAWKRTARPVAVSPGLTVYGFAIRPAGSGRSSAVAGRAVSPVRRRPPVTPAAVRRARTCRGEGMTRVPFVEPPGARIPSEPVGGATATDDGNPSDWSDSRCIARPPVRSQRLRGGRVGA